MKFKKRSKKKRARRPAAEQNALSGQLTSARRRMTRKRKRQILILLIIIALGVCYGIVLVRHNMQMKKIQQQESQLGNTSEKDSAKQKYDDNGNAVLDTDNGKVTIRIIDDGEGESVYVESKKKKVLVDGGCKSGASRVLNALKSSYGTLDYVINTNPIAYRTGGLPEVYSQEKVAHTLYARSNAEAGKDKASFDSFIQAAKNNGSTVQQTGAATIDLGDGVSLRLIPAYATGHQDQQCLACYIKISDDDGFLMTSDAEGAAEKSLITYFQKGSNPVTYFLVGTLGAGNVAQKDFLNLFSNTTLLFSSSSPLQNKGYSPERSLMERLGNDEDSVTMYATYQYGDIVLTSDGNTINCNVSGKDSLTLSNYTHNYAKDRAIAAQKKAKHAAAAKAAAEKKQQEEKGK